MSRPLFQLPATPFHFGLALSASLVLHACILYLAREKHLEMPQPEAASVEYSPAFTVHFVSEPVLRPMSPPERPESQPPPNLGQRGPLVVSTSPVPSQNLDPRIDPKSVSPTIEEIEVSASLTFPEPAPKPTPTKPKDTSTASKSVPQKPPSNPAPAVAAYPVKRVSPVYPSEAKRSKWEGTALLEIWVSTEGRVESVSLVRSSGYNVLDEAAKVALRKWRFQPATRAGIPFRSQARVPITFVLK